MPEQDKTTEQQTRQTQKSYNYPLYNLTAIWRKMPSFTSENRGLCVWVGEGAWEGCWDRRCINLFNDASLPPWQATSIYMSPPPPYPTTNLPQCPPLLKETITLTLLNRDDSLYTTTSFRPEGVLFVLWRYNKGRLGGSPCTSVTHVSVNSS